MYEYILLACLVLYILHDFSYVFRTFFTIITGRLLEKRHSLEDSTTIYGICTFLDCDVKFKSLRLGRLLRDIDFARFHYYDRTGIFNQSIHQNISFLQGCTLTLTSEPVGLFQLYKIVTKLVYWDERSLYLEHEVVTLSDEKVRNVVVSRQYAIGKDGIESPEAVFKGMIERENRSPCPVYIQSWLRIMDVTSEKIRNKDPA